MANATATPVPYKYPKGYDNTQRNQIVRGTFTFTQGAYPSGGGSPTGVAGFPLSWDNMEGIKAVPPAQLFPSSSGHITPIDVDVRSIVYPPSGIVWVWDSANGNLHAMISADASSNNSGPLIEFGGASLPGWMLNDVVEFVAIFTRE